jgi:hypothetical protein
VPVVGSPRNTVEVYRFLCLKMGSLARQELRVARSMLIDDLPSLQESRITNCYECLPSAAWRCKSISDVSKETRSVADVRTQAHHHFVAS